MSLQVNKHLATVSASNTNGISPLTMEDGKENDQTAGCAAAGDETLLNDTSVARELDFACPSSPGTKSFNDEEVFSPSQLSPSQIEQVGGRRRARIIIGEQDPEKNPELFTPPRKVHKFFNPKYKWPTQEEAENFVKFAFAAYHN